MEAIKLAGYTPGVDVNMAIDVAASEFYEDGIYYLKGENKKLTTKELIDYYEELINTYPRIYVLFFLYISAQFQKQQRNILS